jgi:ABC-type uncharacterized transport system fused permease/ATPase subunit
VSTSPLQIHYIPTKPYLAEGTLADQVTYPARAVRDTDYDSILDILKLVKIAYLDQRSGGIFGCRSDSWDTKLSLGEQQRLAIARLLFEAKHRSFKFAFLDECTSAVALDGEEEMYREIASRGLCCVTASQKPWLLQFHSKMVQLSEGGRWDSFMVPADIAASDPLDRLPDVVYHDARQSDGSRPATSVPLNMSENSLQPQSETLSDQSMSSHSKANSKRNKRR